MILGAPPTKQPFWRRLWFITVRGLRRAVLLADTPHRIAMGCACGIFASPLPLFGQAFVGALAAKLLRGNVIASLPWTFLSNPFTTLPIWYGCYRLGMIITPGAWPLVSFERISDIVHRFNQLSWSESFSNGWSLVVEIIVPLVVGATLVGIIAGVGSYFLIARMVVALQERRRVRRQKWVVAHLSPPGAPG
jgi:uncharacterized protein (DUF2062 family)